MLLNREDFDYIQVAEVIVVSDFVIVVSDFLDEIDVIE